MLTQEWVKPLGTQPGRMQNDAIRVSKFHSKLNRLCAGSGEMR